MRIPPHHTELWRKATVYSLGILVAVMLAEVFFSSVLDKYIPSLMLEIFEIVLSSFLLLDVLLWFIEARNKYNFVKRNWLKIAAVLPFAIFFRGLRFLEIETLLPVLIQSEAALGFTTALENVFRFEKGVRFVAKFAEFTNIVSH